MYQDNVYAEGSKFHSFKKIAAELGSPYNKMELVSFMSCSKGDHFLPFFPNPFRYQRWRCYSKYVLIGYMGECGIRGGYVEIVNMDPEVKMIFRRYIAVSMCSNSNYYALLYVSKKLRYTHKFSFMSKLYCF